MLGVFRCLRAMVHKCEGKFEVFQVDAQNLLGIINRGSLLLKLNALARELFRFGMGHCISLTLELVPREENTLADELSKLIILDDCMLGRPFFRRIEERWGKRSVDLFASNSNNRCGIFYSLHW